MVGAVHRVWLPGQQMVAARARVRADGLKKQFVRAGMLFLVLVAQLWIRLAIIEKGYQVEELRATSLKYDALLREKQLELAYVTRPTFLARRSQDELGMARLKPQHVRVVVARQREG